MVVKYVSSALPGRAHCSNTSDISDISDIWTGNVLEWSAFEYIYRIFMVYLIFWFWGEMLLLPLRLLSERGRKK